MFSFSSASTSAVRTPSPVRQRVLLVVFWLTIGALAWWEDTGVGADYRLQHPVQKFSKTPVSEVIDKLDVANAEAAWSNLKIDPQGNLQIDGLTESALLDAIELVRSQPSESAAELATARIAMLLDKQFGEVATAQIMELLPLLKNYKEAEQRFWEANGHLDPPPHAELFRLQDELLGKTLAEKLFGEQRRLLKTMLASQEIRNDPRLTEAEKEQALLDLQKAHRGENASIE